MEQDASLEDIIYFLDNYCIGKIKLIDIGCGDASKFKLILKNEKYRNIDYTGLDSIYWDDKGIKLYDTENMKFIYGDACNMPFEKDSFDIAVLSHVFEHINDVETLCHQIKRIIKPNGKILIIVPIEKGGLIGFLNKYRNFGKNLGLFLKKIKVYNYKLSSPHVQFKTFNEYKNFLSKYFEIIECFGRGGYLMLLCLFLHDNLMFLSRYKFNFMDFLKNHFKKFYEYCYKKTNSNFPIDATFILKNKK